MKKVFIYGLIFIFMLTGIISVSQVKAQASGKTMYVTGSSLNVRQSASTKAKILTTVKKNKPVQVLQTKGTWSKVKVNGKTGWVSNTYLTSKKPGSKWMYVTASSLNVRQSPSLKGKVITSSRKMGR